MQQIKYAKFSRYTELQKLNTSLSFLFYCFDNKNGSGWAIKEEVGSIT